MLSALYCLCLLQAGTASTVDVDIRTAQTKWMSEAPLEVFLQGDDGLEQVLTTQLDRHGKCRVQLEPGTYVFEVLHKPEPNLLVAVKSGPHEIVENCGVRLKTSEPELVKVFLGKSSRCELIDFAVRSAGPTGDLAWSPSHSDGDDSLRLVVTPGARYFARVFAARRRTRYAVWQSLSLESPWKVRLPESGLITCQFDWLASTPKRRSSWVELSFPNSKLRVEEAQDTEVRTNRRYFQLSYGYQTKTAKTLLFSPRYYKLPPATASHEFQLGGELAPFSWSAVMLRKVVGSPETRALVWEAGLRDARGHHLLEEDSDIGWEASIRLKTGKPVPANPLNEAQVELLSRPEDLEIEVRYEITKRRRQTLVPRAWVKLETMHFGTRLPAEWESRGASFLAKLERVYRIVEELQDERIEVEIDLRWITNNAGWGRAPRRGRSYVMLPFRGLEFDAQDWFSHPRHLTHETLHAVGYHHGEEMTSMQHRAQQRFQRLRWHAVDHPEFVP